MRAGASADRPFFDLDCPGGADGRADAWLWVQAIRLSATFRWEHLVHGRGVPRERGYAAARARGGPPEGAVGPARRRIVQQMLTESLVVALAGGAAGLLVAAWGLAAFRSIAPAQFAGLPGIAGVGIDGAS